MNAMNDLLDIVTHDLTATLINMDKQIASETINGLHLQTLINTLKDKAVVSHEELEATWKTVAEQFKKDLKTE
jgi:hypothetical protein